MVAVLKEILVLPNTPTSLIGLLVEKLIGILRDDTKKIHVVSLSRNTLNFTKETFTLKISLSRYIYYFILLFCIPCTTFKTETIVYLPRNKTLIFFNDKHNHIFDI